MSQNDRKSLYDTKYRNDKKITNGKTPENNMKLGNENKFLKQYHWKTKVRTNKQEKTK